MRIQRQTAHHDWKTLMVSGQIQTVEKIGNDNAIVTVHGLTETDGGGIGHPVTFRMTLTRQEAARLLRGFWTTEND